MSRDRLKVALITDTFAIEQGTGVTRYSDELIRGLQESCEIEVMGASAAGPPRSVINHVIVTPSRVLRNKNDFDVFHALRPIDALSLPLLDKPTVVTYHDLVTVLYGKGSSWHVRFSAPHFYKLGKWCSMVIANSSQTKNELVQHLSFPQEKIRVINLGVAERFKPHEKNDTSHLSIGFIGALGARKRVDYLLKAFYHLTKEHPQLGVKLRIFGRRDMEFQNLVKLAGDLNVRKDVEFYGPVPEEDLVNVYNSLGAYVVPSDSEGFGLPILEAQRCGIPVVIRADAHIPDEVGRHCLKATSARHMADILYEILENHALRERVARTGLEYSKRFTWEKTLKETLSVYQEVLFGDLC
jgi:glycosyltransferase involved in cell wall biosynthesis